MNSPTRSKKALSRIAALTTFALLVCLTTMCQMIVCQTIAAQQSTSANWTAEQDHQKMMDQLGIKALRPGPSGNENDPNHANYDEAKANPYGDLPDALALKNGQKVTSANEWWNQRRPEIVEEFEREVVGRIPPDVPKVTWDVKSTADSKTGVFPVIQKQLVGHVDNSACPSIHVDIEMTLVTPGNAKGPVPVMIMFTSATTQKFIASHPESRKMMGSDPPSTEQLIANGWGYALLDTSSIQADNGAGLTQGIIGLTNKGQPRKAEDWGALRAWGWGASRALDYVDSRPDLDHEKIGYYGYSWGAVMGAIIPAIDPRFKANVLALGGMEYSKSLPEVDKINFLPHVKQPTLMLNGHYDFFFPVDSTQIPFYNLLGSKKDQKKRIQYETGHNIPRNELIKEMLNWYDLWLGPVQ